MSTFTLTIDMDNAAFDNPDELPRLLRKAADDVWSSTPRVTGRWPITDANGNTVGGWEVNAGTTEEDNQ